MDAILQTVFYMAQMSLKSVHLGPNNNSSSGSGFTWTNDNRV